MVLCAYIATNSLTFLSDSLIGMSTAILCMNLIGQKVDILIQVKPI